MTFTLSYNGNTLDTDFLRVTDVEAISLVLSKTSTREDSGTNAGTGTITRSNTDTSAPNTFSVVNNNLLEYSATGTLVQSRIIPWGSGNRPSAQKARDVVVLEDGRIAVYNGTTDAYLSILNRTTGNWQHIAVPDLSADNSRIGAGGIASIGTYVFLSDTNRGAGDLYGVVRVDITTGQITRFATKSQATEFS